MSTSSQYRLSSSKYVTIPKSLGTIKKARPMKLTIKQRLRNWLNDDQDVYANEVVQTSSLDSDGMRLQIYKASGGYVVETRKYNRRTDENTNSMHVVTEEQDLGEALGKIVMMEALRG